MSRNQLPEGEEVKKGDYLSLHSLDWEIDKPKDSKRHAVVFQIDYSIKVIGGGGVSVIPSMVRFFTKNGKTVSALSR